MENNDKELMDELGIKTVEDLPKVETKEETLYADDDFELTMQVADEQTETEVIGS